MYFCNFVKCPSVTGCLLLTLLLISRFYIDSLIVNICFLRYIRCTSFHGFIGVFVVAFNLSNILQFICVFVLRWSRDHMWVVQLGKWPFQRCHNDVTDLAYVNKSSGTCSVCLATRQLHIRDGTIHRHGTRRSPCPGSNLRPLETAPSATDCTWLSVTHLILFCCTMVVLMTSDDQPK